MPVLVGRDGPLALIDRCLTEVSERNGRLLLVTGEAGIGKTALVQEVLDRAAAAGFVTARTRGSGDVGAPPLWPWFRLARTLPALAPLLVPPQSQTPAQRFGAFDAVSHNLLAGAEERGLVLAFDDMHAADPVSLQLLQHLAADLAGSRLLLVVAARHAGTAAWEERRPELARVSGAVPIALQPLTGKAVEAWVRQAEEFAGWRSHAAQLVAMTDGNPFYLKLLAATSPSEADLRRPREDIVADVAGRLRQLPAATVELVEIVAVAGNAVSMKVLAGASGQPESSLAALLGPARSAELIGDANPPRLRHPLVRDAIVAGLDPQRRSRWHRAVAAALVEAGSSDDDGSIAEHWRQAGGREGSANFVSWAGRAAKVAAARFDPERAALLLVSALDHAQQIGLPSAERATLAIDLATCQFRAGEPAAALKSCELAMELAEQSGRPDLMADATLVTHGMGSWQVARVVIDLCERALAALPDSEPVRRARVLARLSAALTETVDPARGAELSLEAMRSARATGDPEAELDAIAARHLAIAVPGSVHERADLARRAIELGRAGAGTPDGVLWGRLWLLMALHQLGDLDGAAHQADEIGRIAERDHSPLAQWHHLRIRAGYAVLAGDFARAYELSRMSLRLGERMGDESMVGIHFAFCVALAVVRGDPGQIEPGTVEALRSGPRMPLLKAVLVLALATQGEHDEARAVFEELRALPDAFARGVRWVGTIGQIGLAAVALGDSLVADRAYRLTDDLVDYYDGDGSGFIVAVGSMSRVVADFALTAGHLERAIELFADAVIANVRIGARPFVALARLGWATALLRRWDDPGLPSAAGDLGAAAALAEQAAAEFRRLEMPGQLTTAERLLVALAAAQRRGNPLSARENEVAGLVVLGLRNKEIADRLFLSERTVESHVRSILLKLDLNGRAELAGWFSGRGPPAD